MSKQGAPNILLNTLCTNILLTTVKFINICICKIMYRLKFC